MNFEIFNIKIFGKGAKENKKNIVENIVYSLMRFLKFKIFEIMIH